MIRQVRLGDTEVIQAILARLDNLNGRMIAVETTPPRGIASVAVNAANHLIIAYTDGSSADAGLIAGGGTPVPVPILATLTPSGTIQIGTASSGTISGATTGSAIVSNIAGMTVNSPARTYTYDGSGTAQTVANGLVETLPGATGSPKSSPVTVIAAGVAPSPFDLSANDNSSYLVLMAM